MRDTILALLPATSREIREAIGRSPSTTHKWIVRLREDGAMHIGKRRRTKGDQAAVWVAGPGHNAQRLQPISSAQLQRRYRRSLRELGLYEDVLADQRRYRARVKPPRPLADPLSAWIPRRTA